MQNLIVVIFNEGFANLKVKYFNSPVLIFQHLLVRERVSKIELNRMRNGYIIDTLISVDFEEVIKSGGKVFEIYEGVIYRENIRVNPFERVIGKLFEIKNYYKDQIGEVMELLVKLLMN